MNRLQLIPAIDLRGGRVVRLLRGDFGAETTYEAAPEELRDRYEALGASWLHVVDLDGARDGAARHDAIVGALTKGPALRVQVGGGVRSLSALRSVLAAGASRGVVGSLAVSSPEEVRRCVDEVGAERIVLAFDVRLDGAGVPFVTTHGWTRLTTMTLWDAVAPFADTVQHVLCTDVARDGAMSGPNLGLYAEAVRRFPDIAWQASGGVRDVDDLRALERAGVAAAICGRALLEGQLVRKELRPFLPNASSPA